MIHVSQSCILPGTSQAPGASRGDGHRALKRTADNQLAYREAGRAATPEADTRPSILLVHGWGVSGALFEAQLDALSADFRVVAPDLPGHGASAPFPPGAEFGWLADRVADLISELRLRDLCLVGWSLGAMVAWDLLRRHPGAPVDRLVTIDMVPRLLNDESWLYGLRAGSDHCVFDRNIQWILDDWPGYTELFISRIFARGGEARQSGLLARARSVAASSHPPSMARIWAQMVEQDFRDDLADIRLPTVVATGALSQLYGKPASDWIVRHMPRARSLVFEASGHAPHLEEPEAFNRALADFAGDPAPDTTGDAALRQGKRTEL